jgi:peptidoglycan/xylan/chitin deacetylase (PgdA/CDA1 family)
MSEATAGMESPLKRWPKSAFYRICLNGGPVWLRNMWLRLRRRTRYTVLLYHRVNDSARDNLTISPARFAEHLDAVTRRYPVVGLRAAIEASREGRYLGPNVVIVTFDDGYADNHDAAAPILERFGVPATFFVTVGFVGTANVFEHDRHVPGRFGNLTWDQLRSLVARGFEVGSHGLSHANLARCMPDAARQEIADSKAILERTLGVPIRSFAYPFGGRQDVTEEVLREIRAAGYDVVASAHGGVNHGAVDPTNVLRTGASGAFDIVALRAQIEGVSLQSIRGRVRDAVGRARHGAHRNRSREGRERRSDA